MITDSIHRYAARVITAFFALGFVACAIIGASLSITFAAYVFGGITLGPVLTVLVQQVGEWKRSRRPEVIGRDVRVPTKRQRLAWERERKRGAHQ